MVYCGKPSKGCQMCRTRRIKCDETKPVCNQCIKARRECPGYKDEFDLVLRNENQSAKRRALKITTSRRNSSKKSPKTPPSTTSSSSPSSSSSSSSSASSTSSPTPSYATTRGSVYHSPDSSPLSQHQNYQQLIFIPSNIPIPVEDLAPCHFVSNFVLVPRRDGTRGFMDYLLPLLTNNKSTPTGTMTMAGGGGDDHLQHAFNACALAALGNRTGAGGGGWGGHGVRGGGAGSVGKAFAEYSRALKSMRVALMDPERCRSDGVLAAVLLLGMFENITAKQIGNLAWGSHVQGAVQLVKARGRNQLRTKVGLQLFIAVRTQLIIHTLTSGTAPAMGVDWWIDDAIIDEAAAECQKLNLRTGELRAEATRIMASVSRTPDNIELVKGLMCRAQALDEGITNWMSSVPEGWKYKTVCWQSHSLALPGGGSDYSKAEVFPGRVDVYRDFWVASLWNLSRTTRLILMSITVRCAAWVCSPVDYRTTPEYANAARSTVDMITDIVASVPYHLGWHTKGRGLFSDQEDDLGFPCGGEDGMKGLAGYFLTWPLACAMTQDHATDAQRAYIRGRLRYIGDEVGIKYAHILSELPFRMPSMLIRSDGLLAKPYPMAHNFEKLLSSARQEPSLSEGYTVEPLQE